MPDAIAKLAALFEAATKGEWRVHTYQIHDETHETGGIATDDSDWLVLHDCETSWQDADRDFVIHVHNMMPRILDVLRAGMDIRRYQPISDFYGAEYLDALNRLINALDALLAQPTGSEGGV
jgi:hypothetical protein